MLCIAEKPSVAREIAYIIGAKSRKDGYFEGNGYQVTWTFGHLCTLKMPEDYQADWKKWDLNILPMMPEKFDVKLIGNKGVKKQFGTIKKLLKQTKTVINCGDAGQEGELIQRWVLKHAKYKGQVLRLWISSLTPEAIRNGFKNLKPASEFDNLYYAGSSRAVGDWLLGMNATRLYTLKYGGFKQVLSIGRVQTPTLAMLVARHLEIINFVPKPYWELHTLYRDVLFQCTKGKFDKKETGEALLKQVTDKLFTVTSYQKKNGVELPPSLFDLTSLQVFCNKRFSFSADQTLKIVQKLYEQKVVTYPRVDTTYLPNDVYPKIGGILGKMNQYSQFTKPLLGKPIRKSSKVFNDKKVTDHHAIIPTGFEKNLVGHEQKVYDAIARRFIAAFYPDCKVARATVTGEVDKIEFKATGKEILSPGWRVLYPKPVKKTNTNPSIDTNSKKKEEERILPAFTKGETGPHDPTLLEKMTKPPKYYTEATLLRAMETAGKQVDDEELRELMKANGIGRPSTRAAIIETLFKRKYITRKKKNLIPTDMGIQLIDRIENDLLKSAELTGQWERQLRDIASGEYKAGLFIKDMKNMVANLVQEVKTAPYKPKLVTSNSSFTSKFGNKQRKISNAPLKGRTKSSISTKTLSKKSVVGQTCPKCRTGELIKGKTAYGCSNWKTGCSFRLPFKVQNKAISENQLLRLIAKGSTVQLKGFEYEGSKTSGKVILDRQFEVKFIPAQEQSESRTKSLVVPKKNPTSKKKPLCPKCGIGHIVKGKTAYGCSNWKTGCTFKMTFEEIRTKANGRALTKEFVLRLLGESN